MQFPIKGCLFSLKLTALLVVALLDIVADFFFTNAGNVSPCAVPIVEAVDILLSTSSSSAGSGGLEASSFSGAEEGEEDKQADEKSFH